ncbi:hypothetical protein H5410_033135 [Solanum commersonii]|uniref:Uncharacterized protein n=1 Tax=Solanum commersonii TaxID=4109 RepID=A0A9J5YP97_SOLCO|nr:hypothetical protein H5410_033135 [Solanum commersonii]
MIQSYSHFFSSLSLKKICLTIILLPRVTYSYGHYCGGEDDRDTSIFRYFISVKHKKKESNKRFYRVVGKAFEYEIDARRVSINEFNFVDDITEALLDHEPLKDRLDALRECKEYIIVGPIILILRSLTRIYKIFCFEELVLSGQFQLILWTKLTS